MRAINLSGRRTFPPGLVYCGRKFGGLEASPLGNPCSIRGVPCPICRKIHYPHRGPTKAGKSVECYRVWLFREIRAGNQTVVREIMNIPPTAVLGCWCLDAEDARTVTDCHTGVIARAAEWLRKNAQAQGAFQ